MVRSFFRSEMPHDGTITQLRRRDTVSRRVGDLLRAHLLSSKQPPKRPPAPSLTYAEWRKRAREKLAGPHHAREGVDAPVHYGEVGPAGSLLGARHEVLRAVAAVPTAGPSARSAAADLTNAAAGP